MKFQSIVRKMSKVDNWNKVLP